MNTLVLAHYYTEPEVQQMADYVGDSLDLAQRAAEQKADRIVFAGVRFMAETAKLLNRSAEVILPDFHSTCSLVEQTNLDDLRKWRESLPNHVHVAYINSSIQHKGLADIIVTSRNVDDVIRAIYETGKKVAFSPDRNMGIWLKHQYAFDDFQIWNAVCEVHDQFAVDNLFRDMREWSDGNKFVVAHPESPLSLLKVADFVGSTKQMLDWVKNFPYDVGSIWVATEEGLLYNMRKLRPGLVFRQVPTYTGCQCNQCPFMRKNTVESVQAAIDGTGGFVIDYIDDTIAERAKLPIERMLEFQHSGKI